MNRNKGIYVALLSGFSTVFGLTVAPTNPLIVLLSVILLPLITTYIFTRNLSISLIIIWLNELIFGMSGAWLKIGFLPGRGLLLLFIISTFLLNRKFRQSLQEISPKTHKIIIFYSIVFPGLLFFWGVLYNGAEISNALSDILRFFGLLGFYPLYYLFSRYFPFIKAWILTAVLLLSSVFIFAHISSDEIRILIVDNWVYLGRDMDKKINYIRLSYESILYGFIGLFYGLLLIYNKSSKSKTISILLVIVNLLPIILNFLRGPILSIFISAMLFIAGQAKSTKQLIPLIKTAPAILMVFIIGSYFLLQNPLAENKLIELQSSSTLEDYVKEARVIQTKAMLDAWIEAPFLGKGVGIPLEGYYRGSGLSAEVQYAMVLYRTGIVGLFIVTLPFFFLAYRIISYRIKINNKLHSSVTILELSIALTLLSLGIASFFNPYLASSVTITLFIMYLAAKETEKLSRKY
ncbi:MAG: hypothetical protein QJT81_08625 [Candidatus Thiothrix putei]|uniref:O-antigen ligase domain-containing protein n=1 Tax=Candidatus Thiothrix putei TaxID=3080811 RepID=A0AA95HKS3_9GAMM|nr:MAG: hypothetical protein QJT81_08625 [Candidatus Thiothrix putei]